MSVCSPSGTARRCRCLGALIVATLFLLVSAPHGEAITPTDGRAWELVTPPEPSSSKVLGNFPLGGEDQEFVYSVVGPPASALSGSVVSYSVAHSEPTGWLSTPLGMPYQTDSRDLFVLFEPMKPVSFSEDRRTVLWASSVPLTSDPFPEPGEEELGAFVALYRQPPDGSLEFIDAVEDSFTTEFENAHDFAGISSDGEWVVFDTWRHLLPIDAGRRGKGIYAWHDGALQEVDVDNEGASMPCGGRISRFNGMSAAGTRVFFTTPGCEGEPGEVYVRDLEDGTTTQVSASQCTREDCNAPADVSFAGASADGRTVYMTTTQQLTNEDRDSGRDLYSYEIGASRLALLSGGSPAATGEVAEGVVVPSEIPGWVYFRASGALLPGEAPTGEKLYFVGGSRVPFLVAEGSIPVLEGEPQIQLSATGRRALFVTTARLLPGDTDNQADAYLYDADEGRLTRISTGPSGGNGAFSAGIAAPSPLNQNPKETGDARPYYAIDSSGERAFFTTEESLVPEDTNEKFDVYEYTNGAIGLVTPGDQPYKSDFAGISRDGRTAMFATNADLTPDDRNGHGRDLYAARIGGGFPHLEEAGCSSQTCPLPEPAGVVRETPPSTVPAARRRGRLRLLRVAHRARRGRIAVRVSAPAPGLVSGRIWIRRGRRKIVLAAGSVGVASPGRAYLALKLRRRAVRRRVGRRVARAHLVITSGKASVSRVLRRTRLR